MFKNNSEQTTSYRRQSLGMTAVAMVVVYILWNIPALDVVLYPLQLFTTYVHEAGHALATLITGGTVNSFSVALNTSGVTSSSGGIRWLIIPAGYLGAALLGSLMFFIVNRFPRLTNPISVGLGVSMAIFTVIFSGGDIVALSLGVGFGLLLMVIGLRANPMITMVTMNILAVSTALDAFFSLRYLIFVSDASNGRVVNDAMAFSREVTPFISASLTAFTWAGIAIVMFAMAFYYGVWKQLGREITDSYHSITNR